MGCPDCGHVECCCCNESYQRNLALAPYAEQMFDLLCTWFEAWQYYELNERPHLPCPRVDEVVPKTDDLLRELKLRLGE